MADKEWNPDEPDPVELQKEQLAIAKEYMERLRKHDEEEAKRKAAEQEYIENHRAARVQSAPAYTPLTPEEVSAVFKKAWDETKRIMPDAPERVQLVAFHGLLQAFSPRPGIVAGF